MHDLISRQAVLNYIDNMPSELTADGRRMIRKVLLMEYIQNSLPSAQPDWNELLVICDNCGHAISVKKGEGEANE